MKESILESNKLIEQLSIFSRWAQGQIIGNDSTELNDDCTPSGKNYGDATLSAFATAFAHSNLLIIIASNIFRLNQGDITEEQFHHAIEEDLDQLEKELEE